MWEWPNILWRAYDETLLSITIYTLITYKRTAHIKTNRRNSHYKGKFRVEERRQ